ncbi:RadC family protein [Dethiothermospora halolimnae]|uniref:RadC family protein n=1 Tax=Dethiothermospora halolimnae TaxID=3114390 RepID=UPI003CCBA1A3
MSRQLIKERASKYGVNTLMDFEILALLTNIKVEVLQELKNINELRDKVDMLEITDLQKQKLKALFDISTRIAKENTDIKDSIKSPKDIAELLKEEMRYLKKEEFRIVLLDTKNKVIDIKTISVGSLNASIVHPREVFKEAILKSSASIILVHNHPSGNPSPSKEDINITERLIKSGDLIGIKVLDHVIIGNSYTSLKEEGII